MNTELVNIKINHFLLRLYWCCCEGMCVSFTNKTACKYWDAYGSSCVRLLVSFSRLAHTQQQQGRGKGWKQI